MPPKYVKTIREEIYYEYAVSVMRQTHPNLVRVRLTLPESNDLLFPREGLLGNNVLTFAMLTEETNKKFCDDNKVSLLLRERFRES